MRDEPRLPITGKAACQAAPSHSAAGDLVQPFFHYLLQGLNNLLGKNSGRNWIETFENEFENTTISSHPVRRTYSTREILMSNRPTSLQENEFCYGYLSEEHG